MADQLLEVYGMDSARFLGFIEQVFIDTCLIRKININEASMKELLRHPYIDYYLAKTIASYRQKKGYISSLEELKKATGIPDDIYNKINPYLSLSAP
jgi:transcriptional accessory protein Tex/SPT6